MPSTIDNLPARELADIHFVYGYCDGNARAAAREYHLRFPTRRVIDYRVFIAVHRELSENGLRRPPRERAPIVSAEMEERVLRLVYQDPTTSTRRIALQLGMSHTKVWKILNKEGLYPFHFRKVQNLHEPDYDARVVFCSWLMRQRRLIHLFCDRILWTDEANFNRTGITNFRNLHKWMPKDENPFAVRPASFQVEFSINVWAGMIGDHLIGPFVLPSRLSGPAYLTFLQEDFPGLMEDVDLATRRWMWFQHDGAPAHFSTIVRDYLRSIYSDRWVGRGGPVAWPARSPDLTPLDFYLWGHMKQLVYSTPIQTREELMQKIIAAGNQIRENRDVLRRTTRSVAVRAVVCLEENGGHFENLINSFINALNLLFYFIFFY